MCSWALEVENLPLRPWPQGPSIEMRESRQSHQLPETLPINSPLPEDEAPQTVFIVVHFGTAMLTQEIVDMLAGRESDEHRSPGDLAEQLLAERDVIANFVSLVEALEATVRDRERLYGIESSELSAAIEDGRISETADVCNWLLDYELLRRATAIAR